VGCSIGYVNKVKQDKFTSENTAKHWNKNPADARYYEERGIDLPETRTDAMGRTRPTSYKTKPEPDDEVSDCGSGGVFYRLRQQNEVGVIH
jgi:hypothetical protein